MSSPFEERAPGSRQSYRPVVEVVEVATVHDAVLQDAVLQDAVVQDPVVEHAVVQAAVHRGAVAPVQEPAQVVTYNPDAPSEEWGWHGHWSDFAPRGRNFLLCLGVFGLWLMIWGNQVSHVEDYYLGLTGLVMLIWLILGWRSHRRKRRVRP